MSMLRHPYVISEGGFSIPPDVANAAPELFYWKTRARRGWVAHVDDAVRSCMLATGVLWPAPLATRRDARIASHIFAAAGIARTWFPPPMVRWNDTETVLPRGVSPSAAACSAHELDEGLREQLGNAYVHLPARAERLRRWLDEHDACMAPADKSLGIVIARNCMMTALRRIAFQLRSSTTGQRLFVPADPSADVTGSWRNLCKKAARYCYSKDWQLAARACEMATTATAPLPPAVDCVKLHGKPYPRGRPVIACASRGVNGFTLLIKQIAHERLPRSYVAVQDTRVAALRLRAMLKVRMFPAHEADFAACYVEAVRETILDAFRSCKATPVEIELIKALMEFSYFTLDGEVWQQVGGVFIGMGCAPDLAFAPLVVREAKWNDGQCSLVPVIRYADDLFTLVRLVIDEYRQCSGAPLTQNEAPLGTTTFAGLEISAIPAPAGSLFHRLAVEPYIRPFKRLRYMPRDVPHPRHIVREVAINLFVNLLRLCSTAFDTPKAIYHVACLLVANGYSAHEVHMHLTTARWRLAGMAPARTRRRTGGRDGIPIAVPFVAPREVVDNIVNYSLAKFASIFRTPGPAWNILRARPRYSLS